MKVNRMIIHNLKKEQQEKAELLMSDNALDTNDEKVISIITELNSRYKSNYNQGVFSKKVGDMDTFQKEFDIYLKNKKPSTAERFFVFSEKTIKLLYSRIDSIQAAKGGYIVYADYEPTKSRHYFSVFLIRDVTGKVFKSKKNVITVEEIVHADTANLAMACRIDISKYKDITPNSEDTYLGFISVKQPETSAYFLDWIGAERRKRNNENSKKLLSIITNMDSPNDKDGKPIERSIFYRQVYDTIKTFGKNDINVNTISSIIFNDDAKIMDYAEENDIELETEFYPDNSIFKRLKFHSAQGEDIHLRYPPTFFMDKIKISDKDSDTIIIKSKSLVDSILREENKQ